VSGEAGASAWQRYRDEHPIFVTAAERIEHQLREITRAAEVRGEVTARAKEVASFAKKIRLRKYDDPWGKVTDKVGARIVVETLGDLAKALAAIEASPLVIIGDIDDKLAAAPVDKLAYPGIHLQVSVPGIRDAQGGAIECEVQLRTRAQDLWSVQSHKLTYKGVIEPSHETSRRIYRLVALVELFDSELEAAMNEILSLPNYELAQTLDRAERLYLQFMDQPGSQELSIEILRLLTEQLDDLREKAYPDRLAEFAETHHDKLRALYDQHRDDFKDVAVGDRYLLLTQPESLVVFECIENRRYLMADRFSGDDLESLLRPLYGLWGRHWPEGE
jgi:ppGpp synthetase/RelA/SpoT-type nucleotidyltranferase